MERSVRVVFTFERACTQTCMIHGCIHVCICSACFCVHAFLLWLVWDQCSTVDGACSTLKMFNILIIQLPVKGGEMQRESSREREGTCSDPGQIIRDYTNHAHIHLQSLLHIHSALLTAVWCSIRHIYYSPHSVIQKGGAFCARQQAGNLWHFCVVVCDCVFPGPLSVTGWGQGVCLEREAELPW